MKIKNNKNKIRTAAGIIGRLMWGGLIWGCLIVGGLAGCAPIPKTALLWTDRPELVEYVELFNGESRTHKIAIQYEDDIARAFGTQRKQPDIVIGQYIANHHTAQFLRPIRRRTLRKIDIEGMYRQLLALGNINNRQRLIPLSFNLPAVQFLRSLPLEEGDLEEREPEEGDSSVGGGQKFWLSFDEIQDIGTQFNGGSPDRWTHLGLSPLWDTRMLYTGLVLFDANFSEARDLERSWNEEAVERTLEYFDAWIENRNGGLRADEEFQLRYLNSTPQRLIQQQRIRFSYIDSEHYFQLPDIIRRPFDIRWIGERQQIPVLDTILFAGIGLYGDNIRGGYTFLEWLFDRGTQERLLQLRYDNNTDIFGIAGGFSSFVDINEKKIIQFYDDLIGYVPQESILRFPTSIPYRWEEIRNEVVEPWMYGQLNRSTANSLRDALQRWDLVSGN